MSSGLDTRLGFAWSRDLEHRHVLRLDIESFDWDENGDRSRVGHMG